MKLKLKFKMQSINMKKKITLGILLLSSLGAFAQVTREELDKEIKPLNEKVKMLQSENGKLKSHVGRLNIMLSSSNKSIDSLKTQTKASRDLITQTSMELGIKIKKTGDQNTGKITEVSKSLSKNSLYGIISVLLTILLLGLLYWLLSKRQRTDKNDVEGKLEDKTAELKKDVLSHIENTKTELTTESAKLDIQLLNLIEKQLQVADKINATEPTVDHTFHKNSANELQRIANYANTLDPNSQEAIALQGSLGRLRNYFNSSDFEIIDFAGIEYDERIPMKRKDTIYDETLPLDKEVILKTLKPQIKFKGSVIQEAEVVTKYNN